MRGMTVGAAGHQFRISQPVILAVVAFFVGFYGQIEDTVALHHFFIAMALHACCGMEFCVLCGFLVSPWFYFMETMAVVAGRRILIAGHERNAVRRLEELGCFLVVALLTGFDYLPLVFFPGSHLMDCVVTVAAANAVEHVYACVMFTGFLFVAADT